MTEYNKVVYDGQTLIDLTQDDVTASDVRSGVYFHSADGVRTQGTADMSAPVKIKTYTTPSITVSGNNATWVYSLDLHPDTISGYTPVGCFNPTPNSQSSLICQMTLVPETYGSRFVGVVRNITSGSLSDTFAIPVLYFRDDLV